MCAASDDDPVLTLGDSSLDTEEAGEHPDHVVIVDEEERRLQGEVDCEYWTTMVPSKWRENSRNHCARHYVRPYSYLALLSSNNSLDLACVVQSDATCPHGVNSPFPHVHTRTPSAPSAHISLVSSTAFSPSPAPSRFHFLRPVSPNIFSNPLRERNDLT